MNRYATEEETDGEHILAGVRGHAQERRALELPACLYMLWCPGVNNKKQNSARKVLLRARILKKVGARRTMFHTGSDCTGPEAPRLTEESPKIF